MMQFILTYALAFSLCLLYACSLYAYGLWLKLKIASEFVQFVKEAPVGTGVCCCGDNMHNHCNQYSCGHTPRDEWDYALHGWIEILEKERICHANN